jgi:hypothetical protein
MKKPPKVIEKPHAVVLQDKDHRDLEATVETDGHQWQLWVDIETKNAVVSQRFKDAHVIKKWKVTIPADQIVDYEHFLRGFVDEHSKK